MNLKVIIDAFVTIIIVVTLGVEATFRETFISRCQNFPDKSRDCEQVWAAFEKAYVGKPSNEVPVSAYNDLMTTVPFIHPADKTMLWSKTGNLASEYTSKLTDCFSMRDTLLGNVLNDLTWCGKVDNKETFTTDCPGWKDDTPVKSFWDRVSAGFAEYASGEVTVMLDGSLEKPFDPNSVFAKIEIIRLRAPKVKHLNVILVAGKKSNCDSANIKVDLRNALDPKITYICKEVKESWIEECSSVQNMGCAACLLKKTG